jgi:hypothetical protein
MRLVYLPNRVPYRISRGAARCSSPSRCPVLSAEALLDMDRCYIAVLAKAIPHDDLKLILPYLTNQGQGQDSTASYNHRLFVLA